MIRENIAEFLEDKNFVMLLTTMLYVAGLLSFFYDKGIYCAAIVTILSLIAIFKKLLNLRFVILLVAMFYLGYINAFIQIFMHYFYFFIYFSFSFYFVDSRN